MPSAALPIDEVERLAALAALQLSPERSPAFDIFPYLASKLFDTPMAAVSFVEQDRQWFKASVGLDATETPRDVSFCAHAMLEPGEILYVPDATKDSRFADNGLVVGDFGLRFYAGCSVMGPSGHPVGAVCVIDRQPRTVSKKDLEQLRHLAVGVGNALSLHASLRELEQQELRDVLTDLLNWTGFQEALPPILRTCRGQHGGRLALLFMDLDGFKAINDLFGHSGGDAALQEVARRLRAASRRGDLLCRFGGDKFCLLVRDMQEDELTALAHRIHVALGEPFTINRQIVPLGISIGISSWRDASMTAEELIHEADRALYGAKRAGRGSTHLGFAGQSAATSMVAGRISIQHRLRAALVPAGHEPFALALQPLFDGGTVALTGFEALVRWPQPDGQVLPPDEFIAIAEATGLVVALDRWVLNEACRLAKDWPRHLSISSNLAAANFLAGGLVDTVRAALEQHGLEPGRLKLEITETTLLHDPASVQATIAELRTLGVSIVLDDFGSGHASIGYLREFTLDGLKIDRSLTSDLGRDTRGRAILGAVIDIGQAFDLEVTAEGVETTAQLQQLRDLGIATVQGYLLGRPMSPEAAAAFIQTYSEPTPSLERVVS